MTAYATVYKNGVPVTTKTSETVDVEGFEVVQHRYAEPITCGPDDVISEGQEGTDYMTDINDYLKDLDEYKARVRVFGMVPDCAALAYQLELEVYRLRLDAIRVKMLSQDYDEPPVS
jgi:hypothetical protein